MGFYKPGARSLIALQRAGLSGCCNEQPEGPVVVADRLLYTDPEAGAETILFTA